jgi:hypothetical protein
MIGVSLSDDEPIAYYLAKDETACLLWAVNKAKAAESIHKPGVMVSVDNAKLIRHFTPFDFHDIDNIDAARAVMHWFRTRERHARLCSCGRAPLP